ncbi:MAG TPA: Dyp-type peroxidase [Thermoleophilaceae bacterium]
MAEIDQSDLQGNILCGYGNAFEHALFLFLHVDDAGGGRTLLGELAGEVTDAIPWDERPEKTLNVAVTHAGLGALGVRAELLECFPEEFRAGMEARAGMLGDEDESAPDRWDEGLRGGRPQLLVSVAAVSEQALDQAATRLRERLGTGVSVAHEERAGVLRDLRPDEPVREHFGFADGLSQPTIEDPNAGPHDHPGRGTPTRDGAWDDIAPGEFVLGYPDEDGLVATKPPDPLGRNGSFVVVRKLHQHVGRFRDYVSEHAAQLGMPEEMLAAKVVGRWRSGAPLELSPDEDDPELSVGGARSRELNDFRYGDDQNGYRCPVGAHIRRANPRDALGWHGLLTKRHRIIRRGMPYGPAFDGREADRGLMFVCYQASIARQFEFIQSLWLNDGDPFGLGADRDPLGDTRPSEKMTIQGEQPRFLAPLHSFVSTRGGDYFFAPGIAALRALANGEVS